MGYEVEFRDVVWDDLEALPRNLRTRILRAIEQRLASAPHQSGVRLRQSLIGLWKLRVGDYRVVYELTGTRVTIWVIRHRKQVYAESAKRWGRSS